jgi:hypothetical protein
MRKFDWLLMGHMEGTSIADQLVKLYTQYIQRPFQFRRYSRCERGVVRPTLIHIACDSNGVYSGANDRQIILRREAYLQGRTWPVPRTTYL